MDPWIRGSMDPWIHGSMGPWVHGSMDPWIHGSMDPWIQVPSDIGTLTAGLDTCIVGLAVTGTLLKVLQEGDGLGAYVRTYT